MPRHRTESEKNFYTHLDSLSHIEQDLLIYRREKVRLERHLRMEERNVLPSLNESFPKEEAMTAPSSDYDIVNQGNKAMTHYLNSSNLNGSDQSHSAVNLNQHGVNLNHQNITPNSNTRNFSRCKFQSPRINS